MAGGGMTAASFFCAPARFKNMATALSATKTNAQKISIPREDLCGRLGNWITLKNTPFISVRQRNLSPLNHEKTQMNTIHKTIETLRLWTRAYRH